MRTGSAHNVDVELFWIHEGDLDVPPVVLINGAGSSSVMWCRELIDPLLAAGYAVIRFDNRDVGRSTRVAADVAYTLEDLAADLGAVIETLELESVHLVGRSMGGMMALAYAAVRPEIVRTMTLIYTTPCPSDGDTYGLPGPKPHILEAMEEAVFAPRPVDDAERVQRRVDETRLYAGTRYPFDDGWARAEAEADVAHADLAESGHGAAVMRSGSLMGLLSSLSQPTLVLHGTEDPIIDVAHGRLLSDRLSDSTLIEYPGLGHEMPPAFCDEIVGPMLDLFGGT